MSQSRNPQDTKALREHVSAEVPVLVPTPPKADFGAELPADLKDVASAWNEIPDAIRAAILAMLKAACATPQ